MDLGLEGRTALVAGGSSGLGLAIAQEFAAEGANVAIGARGKDRLDEAAASIEEAAPGRVLATSVDVRDEQAVAAWVDEVVSRFGGLDIVVANAGGPPAGTATAFDIDGYREAIELNLVASIGLVLTALPHIRSSDQGRVLLVTSIAVKQPVPGLALSNTARTGLLGFVRSLVHDVGDSGVTVNMLAPGLTRTRRLEELAGSATDLDEMAQDIPLGRIAEPEEFAAAAAFLASRRASFINGTVLAVDGGAYRGVL
jgi:3-oxoacyl-[acyl-carrier protein] reductase